MIKHNLFIFLVLGSTVFSNSAIAQCSNKEFGIFQMYDKYLDQNPDVADTTLRQIFAARLKMQPAALKNLYVRCLFRWSDERPEEARAFLVRELEGFVADCRRRPADDKICNSVLRK